MDCQTSKDDCQIEVVLIKNYAAMLPTEYNKLAVRYFDKEVICAKCTETIDSSDVTICVSSTLNFHFLCLFYEHKFQGKVTEILGFSEISSEHKEILLTNCQSSQMTDEEEYFDDYSETEDYAEEALTDAEEEVEPPTKRSSSVSVGDRYSETYTIKAKQKSPERRMYEQFLKDQSATAFVNMPNPECMWGTKPENKTARVIVKRGIVIDKEFPNGNEVHVVRTDRQDLYSITLCQTCIATNRNSYFKMQLLKDDDREIYYVFRSWGRIGSKRGSTFSETFHKLQDATSEFEHDFEFLSGNKWRERHFFNPKPDYMWLIEMDYTEIGTIICGADGHLFAAGTKSTLPQEIKEILLKVFNVKNIKRALDGYGLDLERLPMGKLTALQISRGSGLLNEAAEQIAQGSAGKVVHSKLMEISNKFYSTLPQTFGNATPTILSRNEQIEKMRRMIDALLDIQFVSHILSMTNQESAEKGLDPIDMQYKKLMTKMEVVPRNHSDFNLITQYISNGAGYTHSYKGFELLDLIRLDRYGDAANFKITFPNRKLLWHGSPIQNYPGILMQGLKIAPPDALQTGHAFGQGVYFADMISKSAGYCRVRHVEDENVGYLLLCEVALGEMKKHTWGGSGGLTSEDTQYNSIWGVGKNYPNPEEDYLHPDGYTIPLGKSIRCTETSGDAGSYLYYNEFIVYDPDQVRHRYLCRVKFLI